MSFPHARPQRKKVTNTSLRNTRRAVRAKGACHIFLAVRCWGCPFPCVSGGNIALSGRSSRYTHLQVSDHVIATDALLTPPSREREQTEPAELQATGTDDLTEDSDPPLARRLPEDCHRSDISRHVRAQTTTPDGATTQPDETPSELPRTLKEQRLGTPRHTKSLARPKGLEPSTTGSTVRYSNQLSYGPKLFASTGLVSCDRGSDVGFPRPLLRPTPVDDTSTTPAHLRP